MSPDERVEALTHSVELLASLHVDNEKRWAESIRRMESQQAQMQSQHTEMRAQHVEMQAQHVEMRAEHLSNERLMTAIHADMRDILMRLSVIAEAHDEKLDEHGQRISRVEKKLPQ